MTSFTTTIADPATDDPVRVEVFYSMRDEGVLPERPAVRPVLNSVSLESNRDDGAPYELLHQLDNDTIIALAARAAVHHADQMDSARWGNEVI